MLFDCLFVCLVVCLIVGLCVRVFVCLFRCCCCVVLLWCCYWSCLVLFYDVVGLCWFVGLLFVCSVVCLFVIA